MKKLNYLILLLVCFIGCYDVKITPLPIPIENKFEPIDEKEIILYKYDHFVNEYIGIKKDSAGKEIAVYMKPNFMILAKLQVSGLYKSINKVENKMKKEAAKIGGDAIIIPEPGSESIFEIYKPPTKFISDGADGYKVYQEQPVYGMVSSQIGYVIKWIN